MKERGVEMISANFG